MTTAPTEPLTYGSSRLDALIADVSAGALEREKTGERPFAVIDQLRRAGLGALRVPSEQGGGGATLRELFATVIALATADVNVAHILRGHFAHVEERLRLDGEARQRAIDLALRGEIVGNASTELGSTTVGEFTWKTRLTPDGDAYRLSGTKYFTTGTLYADYAEVLAADPSGATVIALVPTRREGVTVVDDWDGMGQRATGTGTAVFDNVLVQADELLTFSPPPSDAGPPPLYLSGAFFQLYVTALEAGVLHAVGVTRSSTSTPARGRSSGRRRRPRPTIRCCSATSVRSPPQPSRPRRRCWPRPTRSRWRSRRIASTAIRICAWPTRRLCRRPTPRWWWTGSGRKP